MNLDLILALIGLVAFVVGVIVGYPIGVADARRERRNADFFDGGRR